MNILFLCTGNSCRSQMAEGWARHLAGDRFEVQSAGIEAHGKNPRAIEVMAEVGIDISGQESTKLTDEMLQQADVLVTVCGHADEHCPVLPPGKRKIHWPLSDPAKAKGSEANIMKQFRATRDEVSERVVELLAELNREPKSKARSKATSKSKPKTASIPKTKSNTKPNTERAPKAAARTRTAKAGGKPAAKTKGKL